MMSKVRILLSTLPIVALMFMVTGCGQGSKTADEDIGGEASSNGAELSLSEITAKASNIRGYKFDIKFQEVGGITHSSKMWVEGSNIRWEGDFEGQEVVYFLNGKNLTAYVYIPSQNMAMKQNYNKAQETIGETPTKQSEEAAKFNAEITGTEVIDGKTCVVAKHTSEEGDETTMWIWGKHGIPVKVKVVTDQGKTFITEFKNIEFTDIPDSKFELPEGVQVIDMQIPVF